MFAEYIDDCEPNAESPIQQNAYCEFETELSFDDEIKTSHENIQLNTGTKIKVPFQQTEICESIAVSSVQSPSLRIDNCDIKTELPTYGDDGESNTSNDDTEIKLEPSNYNIKVEPLAQPDNDVLSQEEWLCTLCNKSYANKAGLTKHIKHQHQKLERFCCPLCDQTFTYNASRTKHINVVHNKSKPFPCEMCNKSFISKSDLTRHARSHTGDKPFSCTLCEKSFPQKAHLVRHMVSIHGQ